MWAPRGGDGEQGWRHRSPSLTAHRAARARLPALPVCPPAFPACPPAFHVPQAVTFLKRIKEVVEDPRRLLLGV